ncbi:MAG: hypothetical protein SPI15_13600 [Candidatus Faecousia sp.]|nr:hypothetical protein [Clostridiales bacterium]MDY6181862.1 hypothetical protein [Candidatus Faecousia sp.]
MRKIALILLCLLILTGCASNPVSSEPSETTAPETTAPETTAAPETTEPEETAPEETEPSVIYAGQIADGTYEISVESSSSMFRVVHCVLTVENGSMTAAMTMSGQGYGFVYLGTAEAALEDTEDSYIPFTLNEDGEKVFTIPVEALNMELDCAAWSIKKETWYDRVLVFSSELLPEGTVTLG